MTRILCVDDEEVPLLLRKRVLEKCGYEVVTVDSARQALEILKNSAFDLVLSDQLMPGMTGTQLAKVLHENSCLVPVILLSGVNEVPPDVSYAHLFISKLEGPKALCEKIAEVLGSKTGRPPAPTAQVSSE